MLEDCQCIPNVTAEANIVQHCISLFSFRLDKMIITSGLVLCISESNLTSAHDQLKVLIVTQSASQQQHEHERCVGVAGRC